MANRKCSAPKCGAKSDATFQELQSAGWEIIRDGISKGIPLIHCPVHVGMQPLFTGSQPTTGKL